MGRGANLPYNRDWAMDNRLRTSASFFLARKKAEFGPLFQLERLHLPAGDICFEFQFQSRRFWLKCNTKSTGIPIGLGVGVGVGVGGLGVSVLGVWSGCWFWVTTGFGLPH